MNGHPACALHLTDGTYEECPGASCAFWESDGCAFERISFEFEGRPGVARWLLGIQEQLGSGRTSDERAGAQRALQAFLPPGLRD